MWWRRTIGLLAIASIFSGAASVDAAPVEAGTYKETTRYFTGGWDSIQDSYLLLCPTSANGEDIGIGTGCNFVCPQDVCRIVVNDALFNNIQFKVCVTNCDPFAARVYVDAANVNVGAGRLFQVYIDRYWASTGTVTSTLP